MAPGRGPGCQQSRRRDNLRAVSAPQTRVSRLVPPAKLDLGFWNSTITRSKNADFSVGQGAAARWWCIGASLSRAYHCVGPAFCCGRRLSGLSPSDACQQSHKSLGVFHRTMLSLTALARILSWCARVPALLCRFHRAFPVGQFQRPHPQPGPKESPTA